MARYGEAFRNRAVARLLPPERVNVGEVSREIGVLVQDHIEAATILTRGAIVVDDNKTTNPGK